MGWGRRGPAGAAACHVLAARVQARGGARARAHAILQACARACVHSSRRLTRRARADRARARAALGGALWLTRRTGAPPRAPLCARARAPRPPRRILEYMVVYYGVASAIGMFAAVCALLLAGFLGHQCWVIGSGTSTYEAAKLRELRARQGAAARRRGGESGSSSEGEGSEAPGGAASARRLGAFHRGSVWANFSEVLFPDRFMRAQLAEREREAEARRQRRGCALLPPPEPLKRRAKSKR